MLELADLYGVDVLWLMGQARKSMAHLYAQPVGLKRLFPGETCRALALQIRDIIRLT